MFDCFKKKKDTRTISDAYLDVPNRSVPIKDESSYRVWIPNAENIHDTEGLKMRTRGEYANGYPEGLVVHWTAGWALQRGFWPNVFPGMNTNADAKLKSMARKYALRTAKGGVKNGYNFLVMDVFSNIYQSRPLTKHGYHAGKSHWQSVGYSVSSHFAGIEILNPGKLELKDGKYMTWFGLEIPRNRVRIINHSSDNRANGYYCQFTQDQELELKSLCNFLWNNSPSVRGERVFSVANIVGHDEVSPKRKTDPGGSLSMSMGVFRGSLRDLR